MYKKKVQHRFQRKIYLVIDSYSFVFHNKMFLIFFFLLECTKIFFEIFLKWIWIYLYFILEDKFSPNQMLLFFYFFYFLWKINYFAQGKNYNLLHIIYYEFRNFYFRNEKELLARRLIFFFKLKINFLLRGKKNKKWVVGWNERTFFSKFVRHFAVSLSFSLKMTFEMFLLEILIFSV